VSHSILVHAAVAPILGEGLRRLSSSLRDARIQTYLGVFLCLATHALLDAMTIYGTRLFWPLWPEPVGLGSIFIIDPVYTTPLLIVTAWALFLKTWTPRYGKALSAALIFSTGYLGWTVAGQQIAKARAQAHLAEGGVTAERMFVTPTPFNSLFWRAVAIDGSRYINLYLPLMGGGDAVTAYVHPRKPRSIACWSGNGVVETLTDFSDGFVRFDADDKGVIISDLRMGMTPQYVFRFVVAERKGAAIVDMPPQRLKPIRGAPGDGEWLLAGVRGDRALRPTEADAMMPLDNLSVAAAPGTATASC
jgi:inner membrane protein